MKKKFWLAIFYDANCFNIFLQVVNSSKEIELLAVNPIETLNSLKQAEKFLCILKKVSLNDGDSESNEDSDRCGKL